MGMKIKLLCPADWLPRRLREFNSPKTQIYPLVLLLPRFSYIMGKTCMGPMCFSVLLVDQQMFPIYMLATYTNLARLTNGSAMPIDNIFPILASGSELLDIVAHSLSIA